MLLETVESKGLAHLSYVLGDEEAGAAAVIDPRRDVEVYLEIAHRVGVRITHILETHIHADFVSGSRELAARTGAPIYVGQADEYGFDHRPLRDGDLLRVGGLALQTLHTPGHTPEHVCFLVGGGKGSGEAWGVFTGDALFAGEVGRPDLLGEDVKQRLARQLYHSLHDRLLRLDDGTVVYPAHGEGSPCGGSIGDRKTTTIGYERRNSPKLRAHSEDEFVRMVLSSLPPAPTYYPRMKKTNAEGPRVLGPAPLAKPLDPRTFAEEAAQPGTIVVDVRPIEGFGGAHIEDSLSLAYRPDEFPIWAGWMLDPSQRVLLVLSDPSQVGAVQRDLLRIGIESVAGYLQGGMRGWFLAGIPYASVPQMSVHELRRAVDEHIGLQVVDVRRDDEWEDGHIPTACHIFLPQLVQRACELDPGRPTAIYCGSGYRASIGASLLRRAGFRAVYNVPGSMAAWRASGYPVQQPREAVAA